MPHHVNRYQKICTLKELRESKSVGFSHGEEGEGFAVYQGGEVYAYQNRCPHVGVELNWQPNQFLTIDNRSIQCAMHGALFRLEDGFCYSGPCSGESLRRVIVAIYGEDVIICPTDEAHSLTRG